MARPGLQAARRLRGETGLHRQQVLRALMVLRQAMRREVPPVFRGTVEVDETSLGGPWRNKRRGQRAQGTTRGRGPSKTPVFGILCRGGQVWAQVVPDVKARTRLPVIRRRVTRGSTMCSCTRGTALPGLPPRALSTAWWRMARASSAISRAPTSTAWRGSGGPSSAASQPRVAAGGSACPSTWRSMCGGTPIAPSRWSHGSTDS